MAEKVEHEGRQYERQTVTGYLIIDRSGGLRTRQTTPTARDLKPGEIVVRADIAVLRPVPAAQYPVMQATIIMPGAAEVEAAELSNPQAVPEL